jgi:8-oxo-dGTP pyrophosphatase MutT (NUDIX family)
MFVSYVAAFLFHEDSVLLVRKTRPPWQVGCLNAVGGKIEPLENSIDACQREFYEETGLDVPSWTGFCAEEATPDAVVHFFWARARGARPVTPPINDVGEELEWWRIADLYDPRVTDPRLIGNLYWLIPMALDPRGLHCHVRAERLFKIPGTWPRPGA